MKRLFSNINHPSSAFNLQFAILIVIQSYSLTVLSQQPHDYQLFRQDATYFYHSAEDSYPSIVGLRLDSAVITDEGTEWYNHESIFEVFISPEMYWCIQPDGPSWMGYKLLVKSNGDNFLYGINGYDFEDVFYDTIMIKTKAMPGDSWGYIRYGFNAGPDTLATVTRMDTMTFLGITDSIKVIDLGVDSIILSKHHGLVRALNFKDFWPYQTYYEAYTLEGITTTDTVIGLGLMTYGDIYNYETGDIFHRSSHVDGWPYATWYEVFEVMDKDYSTGEDTVYYQMSRIQWYYGPGGLSDLLYDTLIETHANLDDYFSAGFLPTESIWGDDSSYFYEYNMFYDSETYNGRRWIDGPYSIFTGIYPDSCYDMMGSNFDSYIEGCGNYIHVYDDYHQCIPCQQLDYFKKGEEEWGNPYTIPTGIRDNVQLDVRIYPVPAEDFIMLDLNRLEIQDLLQITLTDLSGRVLEQKTFIPDGSPYRMDLRGMEKGIYMLRISAGNKVMVRKIVH